MRTAALAAALGVAFIGALTGRTDGRPAGDQAAPKRLAATVGPVIDAVWERYDRQAAFDHVKFIASYWRLPGNPGYNASIERIKARIQSAGLTPTIEEYPGGGPAWDHTVGTLALVSPGKPDTLVISRDRDEKDHIALCINSFSTPAEGVTARLVDVGAGAAADFAGKDVKGAVVLGDAAPGQLWNRAVVLGGAIGIVSASPPARYISPDPPGAPPTPRDQWDIFQWTSVPYDEARKAFGFKASARAAGMLRKQLAAAAGQPVNVRVTIKSTFDTGPVRTLSVEIPGRTAPNERIVLAAHVQEPGANDNASGVATLAETVVSLATAIKNKKVAPPERTLTFLFLNEISGSRRWLQDHSEAAKQVRYMFSLDMTGEDVKKTGGSFLIERYPDPGAVWERPWDPHSEWGAGNVRAESLKGDLINDTHMFVVQQVAKRTGWVVKSNPYEGGSDHTVFQGAGIPSLLNWHFTDRYYHSNYDTPDKTSPDEMRNVGVSVAASAWLLASATPAMATDVANVVASSGLSRISLETTEGAKLAGADAAATAREATILAAWKKWYAEAVRSASRLVVGSAPASFGTTLDGIASVFQSATTTFVCGHDQVLTAEIPLTWQAVVLAGDSRQFVPCSEERHTPDHREVREASVIERGLASPDPVVLWRAAQATARLKAPVGSLSEREPLVSSCSFNSQVPAALRPPSGWRPGQLLRLMTHRDPAVRREAAYGLAVRLADRTIDPDVAAAAGLELRACFLRETVPEIQGLILEAIGVAQYSSDEKRADAERFITQQSMGHPLRVLGAAKGLEALVRLRPQRPLDMSTLVRLRQMVLVGDRGIETTPEDVAARTRRLAIATLMTAGDFDLPTMTAAADDRDWQVRRLLAGRLNAGDNDHASLIDRLADDPAFQVRYDLLSAQARVATRTRICEPILLRIDDPSPAVAMRAMDVLAGTCTEIDDGVHILTALAETLMSGDSHTDWHLPSRALTNLARLSPARAAGERLGAAVTHPVWQVRAAAAATGAVVRDVERVRLLADDREPNVRTAAIEALVRMRDSSVVEKSIAALNWSDDHQLLRTAALSLRGLADEQKVPATMALLAALRKLTDKEWDTSRDPRVAIVDRLAETMAGDRTQDLLPYVADFDDAVSAAARKTFEAIINAAPVAQPQRRRYPMQPAPAALTVLPTQATITLAAGQVTLRLLPDVAPVTVARFAQLARARHYDGKTFHRIVTNFVVQGGSPGANEYAGTNRYMRDEVGPQGSHLRGAVGISTRGGDTGDAQIFIDLVDLPRLDRDYTVFAYVTRGMELIDRMLDGAKIVSISVR